jgi:uncharacterized protein
VVFEYDPDKSLKNQEKHGIDFEVAQVLWRDVKRVVFDTPFEDEPRSGIIAAHDEKLWCAIYTLREEKIRIISVRRARDYEEELYFQSR